MNGEVLLGTGWEEEFKHLFLSFADGTHLLTIAPPGKGKSRRVAIPNLIFKHNCSAVVSDFNAELAKATALWRQQFLGQHVSVVDPMHVVPDHYLPLYASPEGDGRLVPTRAKFDPMDFIKSAKSPHFASKRVAEGYIPDEDPRNVHWVNGGRDCINAVQLFFAFDPVVDEIAAEDPTVKRNTATMWRFLSNHREEKALFELMRDSKDPFVADQGNTFFKASKANTELQGIRNHVRTNLASTFSDPRILNMMSETTVDFRSLSRVPQTIFFCLPGNMADTYFRIARVGIAIALDEIESMGRRDFDSDQPPTYFLFDEFRTFGRFELIMKAMARMRGFGCQFHLMIQALSQLSIYGQEMHAITGATDCVQFFGGTNDEMTANYISKLCGTGTEISKGRQQGSKPGDMGSESQSTTGRAVKMPDEVMRLEMPKQLIKQTGKDVAEGRLFVPDLSEFPAYCAFIRKLDDGGSASEALAAAIVANKTFVAPPPEPAAPQPQARKPAPIQRDFLDMLFAWFLGHKG
jgi:type IV secretion system protein VirD4